jgi:hypothetical protein
MTFENAIYMMQRVPTSERLETERNVASSQNSKFAINSDLSLELYYFDDITIEKANEILKSLKKVTIRSVIHLLFK